MYDLVNSGEIWIKQKGITSPLFLKNTDKLVENCMKTIWTQYMPFNACCQNDFLEFENGSNSKRKLVSLLTSSERRKYQEMIL